MAKSFKKFRNSFNNEWEDDDYTRDKDIRLEQRRQKRKRRMTEKYESIDDEEGDDV